MVRYRNTKTGQIIETPVAQPVFDRSSRWELLVDAGESASTEPSGPSADAREGDTGDGSPPDPGTGDGQGAGGSGEDDESVDLTKLGRPALDELARQAGVSEPEKLQNKAAVIEAIQQASA